MTLARWKTFSKREQLLHIASEFERARVWQENNDRQNLESALERALTLIDLSLNDRRWRDNLAMLLGLREAVGKFYIGEDKRSVKFLREAL